MGLNGVIPERYNEHPPSFSQGSAPSLQPQAVNTCTSMFTGQQVLISGIYFTVADPREGPPPYF